MDTVTQVQPDGSVQHDLGPLITTRGYNLFEKIVFSFLLSLVGAAVLAGLVASAMAFATPKPMGGVVGGAFCLVVLYLCVIGMRTAFRRISFHHHGAIEQRFSKRAEFRYDQVGSLEYSLTRQFVNGIYAGTSMMMRVQTLDGRKFRFDGKHKEKAKGLTLIGMGRKFEGEDEMDVIKDLISAHIAGAITEELQSKARVNWGTFAVLTPEGITPMKGVRAQTLLKWAALAGIEARDGYLHFFVHDCKHAALSIPFGSPNCFAMMQVMGTLVNCAIETPVAEAA